MRTIALVNQKGGCGKTTTAINLAATFARRGTRTLLIDMDPQSHCAAGLGVPEAHIECGVAEAMLHENPATLDPDDYLWEVARNLDLIPSTTRLAGLEAPAGGLHQRPDRDRRLEYVLHGLRDRYDLCLIDCPPTIGLLTFNALRAAGETLIPVETGFFSLKGAEKQWSIVQRTIDRLGRPIRSHLLATLHDPESRNARNILTALQKQFGRQLCPVIIRDHEVLREAASDGRPGVHVEPESAARDDFEALAEWLEELIDRRSVDIEIISETRSPHPERYGSPRGPQAESSEDRPAEPSLDGRPLNGPLNGLRDTLAATSAVAGAPDPVAPAPISSRASELVQRVREIAMKQATAAAASAPAPAPGTAPGMAPGAGSTAPADGGRKNDRLRELFGARATGQGVLFIQPGDQPRSIAVAGDFNNWSDREHRLRYHAEAGVYQLTIDLSPGRHEYRMVIDGEWQTDPYNREQALNAFGEASSVIVVPDRKDSHR